MVDGWDDDTRVFVDPLTPLNPETGEELADAVADASVPVYTAVVPLDRDDESEGDAEVLAHALAHTSGRDGVYVVVDGLHGGVGTALLGVDAGVQVWDLNVSMSELPEGAPVTAAALELLDRLGEARSAPGAAPTVPLAAEFHADAADDGEPSTRAERYHAEGLWPGLLILGPMMGALLWFVCAGVALLLPWSVRWTRATPGRRLRPMARRAADRAVAALAEHGLTRLLTEGGPRLLGQFVAAGVLDELCLTVSPMLTAGDAQRIACGPSVALPKRFSPVSVLEEAGFLFTRYRRTDISGMTRSA